MRGPRTRAAPPIIASGDSMTAPPPAVDTPAHVRRIYNVVDPSALARVWAAAVEKGYDAHSARLSVLAFVALMREPYHD